MPAFTIAQVSPTVRDWDSAKGGPMKSYRIDLADETGHVTQNVEWARKATSPAPEVGQKLDGTVNEGDYGPKFKQAQTAFGGGRGGRSPEERRAIAMQASHKVAIDCLKLAAEYGAGDEKYIPPSAGEVVSQVKLIASGLFQQIEDVAK